MPVEVANYQFQSWMRKGISAQISEQDTLGSSGAGLPLGERASVPIGVLDQRGAKRCQSRLPSSDRATSSAFIAE